MKEKNKKKQIAKISVFITSIFVILFSVTYAFITQVISGTKQVVLSAGVLDLVLEEENSITIENALPMYDEVGMIQEPFTFRLVNNGSESVNYNLKLVDVTPQTVERKCSELGEITLDSPAGCRDTIYPDELRQEALTLCQMLGQEMGSPITTEADCVTLFEKLGAPYTTFEEFMDEGISAGEFEDTRTIGDTYPDNIVEVSVWELGGWSIRYGLTKNGENTIASISDMEYTWKIDDLKLRTLGLTMCKLMHSDVTDEASCLEALKEDGDTFESFDDFIGYEFWPNGNRIFTLDTGKIGANETIDYDLRLWIDEYVEYIEDIEELTFSFKIDVEVSQEMTKLVSEEPFKSENLGENCQTYNDGIDTFLTGQCSNNYVWYSGKLWRVVLKNNQTNAVKLVTDNAITSISYNDRENTSFENSYADQWLKQEFLPTLHDYEKFLIVDSLWLDTVINLPEKPMSSNEDDNHPTVVPLHSAESYSEMSATPVEYDVVMTRPNGTPINRTVGLLNAYEYYTTYANSNESTTYTTGYLNKETRWWLMTKIYVNYLSKLGSIDEDGDMREDYPNEPLGIRPSVNVQPMIKIQSGTGTQTDPYILQGDIGKIEKGKTYLNTRYSGEYVTFNDELYRIVGIEDGLTKITSVDQSPSLSNIRFHSADGVYNFAEADIKIDLENYYQGLKTTNTNAYNMIEPNTTWYLGAYRDENYKACICATVDATKSMNECVDKTTSTTASIGLPRIGEIFTSQITREPRKTFWTLTPSTWNNEIMVVGGYDEFQSFDVDSSIFALYPSMYLKSDVVIASDNTGNGTYEKPYNLSID